MTEKTSSPSSDDASDGGGDNSGEGGVGNASSTSPKAVKSELGSRVISGLVMSAVALGLMWFGSWPFALMISAAAIVMSWEWSRLVRNVDHDVGFIIQGAAVAFAALTTAYGLPALGLIGLIVGAVSVFLLTQGKHAPLSALGVFYVGLPAIALIWLRNDEPFGFWAVLFVCLVVCISDICAYAAGRGVGGPKLWPRVSPNKTWAGFVGALVGSGLVAALFASFVTAGPVVSLALTGVVLGAVAQAGDLVESALKRHFGVKDVSGLIPGHGGFMDRLDSIVFVATCAGVLALLLNPTSPARALFFGI
ncbi:MAG: phosphatidate cytidylyltransferase [Hyphomicrobiaceae bacterium]